MEPDKQLESIRERIGPWERVETSVWKVKGAEFQKGLPAWGRIRFRVSFLGTGPGGGPRSIEAWGAVLGALVGVAQAALLSLL